MKNLKIGTRLQIMAVIAIASLVVLASSGLYVASHLRTSMNYIYKNTLPSIEAIDVVSQDFLRLRLTVLYHFLSKDEAKKTAVEAQIKVLKGKIDQGLVRYEKELVTDAHDKDLLDQEKKFFETYFVDVQAPLESSRAGNEAEMWKGIAQATKNMNQMSEAIDAHKLYNKQLGEIYLQDAEKSDRQGTLVAITLLVLSLLTVGSVSFLIIREIRSRMENLSNFMHEVDTTLNFSDRIPVTRMDELGVAAKAFNQLLDKLQASLKEICQGTYSVAEAAHGLSSTSQQVATAAEQQSEAASDMAATVEEMTVSINHVAERAQDANRLSTESGGLAASGEEIIGQTTSDIGDIANTVHQASQQIHGLEVNSQQIANVVQVIKDVAEQTNLLALNAAIEAARAGEQGRGFAVVADEVRKLAERTSISTQEIAQTIDAMRVSASNAVASMESVVSKVNVGVERSQEANTAIQQIGRSSRDAVEMVEEIAGAIREQGAATNNIALQVEKIAQMSEQSSAGASNCASAAEHLDVLASRIQNTIAAYRL